MLELVADSIWADEQPLKYFGLDIRTRMTIVRLRNGELVVISPIRLNKQSISQLKEIGEVRYVIAPNLYHYLFAAEFKETYPNCEFWAVPGLKEKEPNLLIDRTIGESDFPFQGEIQYAFLDGFKTLVPFKAESLNECALFHAATRTLIITDAAFNFDKTFPLSIRLVARIGGAYDMFGPSMLEKLAINEKEKMSASVRNVLKWDFERIVMAHGRIIENNGREAFSKAYEFVLR